MKTFREYVKEALADEAFSAVTENWSAGPLQKFSEERVKSYGLCVLCDAYVFITCPTTNLHATCSGRIAFELASKCRSVSKN